MVNHKEEAIVIFDEYSLARAKTTQLFQTLHKKVFGVGNEIELFNVMAKTDVQISIIIMDIGVEADHGFEVIDRIRERDSFVPILILTANNQRKTILRGIVEGAADYILKPYDDQYLYGKVLQILQRSETVKEEIQEEIPEVANSKLVFDMQHYLNTELRKASKGNYEITVLMITIFSKIEEINSHSERKYIQVSNMYYRKFKSLIWSTDILERYGTYTFIGIFPFCNVDNKQIVQRKFEDCFDELKPENKVLNSFQLAISSITYPVDDRDAKDLLLLLGVRIELEIDRQRNY